jgi:hypothetical protein
MLLHLEIIPDSHFNAEISTQTKACIPLGCSPCVAPRQDVTDEVSLYRIDLLDPNDARCHYEIRG